VTHWNLIKIFGNGKLESLGYNVVLSGDDMFSRFDRTPACDRQTDSQTDRPLRQTHSIAYTALA